MRHATGWGNREFVNVALRRLERARHLHVIRLLEDASQYHANSEVKAAVEHELEWRHSMLKACAP